MVSRMPSGRFFIAHSKAFPLLSNWCANKECYRKISGSFSVESGGIADGLSGSFPDWKKVEELEDAKELYDQSLANKGAIEEKAKSLVAIASVSTTLIVGLSGVTVQLFGVISEQWLRCVMAIILICAAAYMTAAALTAISIFTSKIKMYVFVPGAKDEVTEYKRLAMLNSLANITRSNNLATSFLCLQRSFVALLVMFSIIVMVA